MAITCSLINRLPPSPPATSSSNPNHPPSNSTTAPASIPWFKSDKLKSRCIASVACIVIGLHTNWAIAAGGDVPAEKVMTAEKVSAPKWSDKRMCPAWQLNSLETIVPEDLPRPFTRRRWESVEFPGGMNNNDRSPAARGHEVVRGIIKGCFSM